MIDPKLAKTLVDLADKYETPAFVDSDPVQFPRIYTTLPNQEIVGFIAAWLAYGNRTAIIKTMQRLLNEMYNVRHETPQRFIINRSWKNEKFDHKETDVLYRFYTYGDFYNLCEHLFQIYVNFESMYEIVRYQLNRSCGSPLVSLINVFYDYSKPVKGIPMVPTSACKRLNMFLRWMVRRNSPVDLGVWHFDPNTLLIPLDTHVARVARELGLITRKGNDMTTVIQLSEVLREVFPKDPARGDFALFGYGVNNK